MLDPVLKKKRPELLAPAGDLKKLKMALAYGADAVYFAGQSFGMRAFAGNFSDDGLKEAIDLCHKRGARAHVTVNTLPREDEIRRLPAYLERLDDAGADALILGDPGAFALAGKYAPHVARHISTQAGVTNSETARFWYELGAARVILARELSLEEIRKIRAGAPRELEIEAFIHGAMCVSFSGRCLLSNYMTGRDASRGMCAQPCRYHYALMEEKRPGEYFPIEEDAQGSYIMNSRDMCLIDHIPELIDAGIDSLKIEGRAKSAYYAAVITGAYRHAIDAAMAGAPPYPIFRDEVERVSHRPYSTGFYFGEPGQYYENSRYVREWQVVASVLSCDEQGEALLSLNNKLSAGEPLELIGPGITPLKLTAEALRDEDGTPVGEVKTPQMRFRLRLPCRVPPDSLLRHEVSLSPA